MARRSRYRSKLRRIVLLLVVLVVGYCVAVSYVDKNGAGRLPEPELPFMDTVLDFLEQLDIGGESWRPEESAPALATGELEVHWLDMGQADSILIRGPDKNVLIDAGENHQGEQVLDYLKRQGVQKLDLAIGTHPHSDHIGGLDTVLYGIPVQEVVLPVLPESIVPTTVTYTDLLMAIAQQNVSLTAAQPGQRHDLGGGAVLSILGPTAEYNGLNNMSVVSRLDFGSVSFLFTGDGEKEAEEDLLLSGQRVSATVMDAGHHGSSTSTTWDFLAAVSPQVVVISCGLDNSYGHPHREVLERLQELDVQVLRTDLNGAVVLRTDGTKLHITSEK